MADEAASQREGWWVLQAQSGSHEALNELFRSVQEPLFRYVVSLVRDQHLAEDILQEVFMRIYRKLRWLREPQAFRAWSYQIASREAFRYLNRERRWTDQVRDEAVLAHVPAAETDGEFSRELIASLPQLVGELSPASRAVVARLIGQPITPQVLIRIGAAPTLAEASRATPRRPIDEVFEVHLKDI